MILLCLTVYCIRYLPYPSTLYFSLKKLRVKSTSGEYDIMLYVRIEKVVRSAKYAIDERPDKAS